MIYGVRLQHFRSYDDQAFELEHGVNIVVGPNASGKTNLLEALYVACVGKSFRAGGDKTLLKTGADWARLDVDTENHTRIIKYEHKDDKLVKSYEIDGRKLRRLRGQDQLPVVLFVPDHLRLLTGAPSRRRQYLDQLIAQLHPARAPVISRYQRVLTQRNALLKQSRIDPDQLFVWNVKLSEHGSKINAWRKELVKTINQNVSETYSTIANKPSKVSLKYEDSVAAGDYSSQLNKVLSDGLDRQRGFTSAGPHREDIAIELNDSPSDLTASRGETRTLVLALKVVELMLVEAEREPKPLLLLDDVFSELDSARRRYLAKRLSGYQTIITTTDADALMKHFVDSNKIALG